LYHAINVLIYKFILCFSANSSVVPIAISILWSRATAAGEGDIKEIIAQQRRYLGSSLPFSGVICGVVGGCVSGISSWLGYASTYPGGLSSATFVKNTGEVRM
jgi:hypothetical protein